MVSFFVPGAPAPQGSKRHVGNGRMVESSAACGPWRERVALAAHDHLTRQIDLPGMTSDAVTVRLDFVLPRPKSAPKRRTPAAVKRPDVDKLARAVLDAITGTVLVDDSQVVSLTANKRLAELDEPTGVSVSVVSVPA